MLLVVVLIVLIVFVLSHADLLVCIIIVISSGLGACRLSLKRYSWYYLLFIFLL